VVVDRSELGRAQEDDVSSVQRYVAEADACAGHGVRAAHQLRSERTAYDCEQVTARDCHADGGCVVETEVDTLDGETVAVLEIVDDIILVVELPMQNALIPC
jgi:hypothetical protein